MSSLDPKPRVPVIMAGQLADRHRLVRNGTRALGACLAVTMMGAFFRPTVLFAWHPTAMSLAYLAVMTDGLLRALEFRPLEKADRVAAVSVHAYVQLLGILGVAVGFVAIYYNKAGLLG